MIFNVKIIFVTAALFIITFSGQGYAAGGSNTGDYKMVHKQWQFNGAFGTYDKASAQRGYQVYREVCSSCHGRYRHQVS